MNKNLRNEKGPASPEGRELRNNMQRNLLHSAVIKLSTLNSQLSTPRGFTLIELLVTIAIIGILSSVLLVNLSGFRERTRDVQRKRDLRTLQTALELYRADTSNYPGSPLPACGSELKNGTVIYLKQSPCDPLTKNRYNYNPTGSTYTLFACLENGSDSEQDSPKQGGCAKASFTVLSP